MKKFLTLVCVCALCVMLPVMAMAITETEWNQQCKLKADAAVTIYSTDEADSTSGVRATDTDIPMWECGTLLKGTYVMQNSYDSQLKMWQISYYQGGNILTAFVREGNKLVSAMDTVSIYDGKSYEMRAVPEALIGDDKALCSYLAKEMPGYTFSIMVDGKTVLKEQSSNSGSTGGVWMSLQQRAKEAAKALNLNLDELQQAIIYAPKSGSASLWPNASAKNALKKLSDGTVVYIVSEGGKYTQVLADDMTGYVINGALEMLDHEQLPLGEGMLSYNGETSGNRNIDLLSHSKKSRIEKCPVGTEVLVWSAVEEKNEEWYEIEYEGVRYFVQPEYLTITELYSYDEEEPVEETPVEEEPVVEETPAEEAPVEEEPAEEEPVEEAPVEEEPVEEEPVEEEPVVEEAPAEEAPVEEEPAEETPVEEEPVEEEPVEDSNDDYDMDAEYIYDDSNDDYE